MDRISTRQLSGTQLDWAVAISLGLPVAFDPKGCGTGTEGGYWVWQRQDRGVKMKIGRDYSPSTKLDQCAPLIELYQINLSTQHDSDGVWGAFLDLPDVDRDHPPCGDTPQMAICRCVVDARFGDAITIPADLI